MQLSQKEKNIFYFFLHFLIFNSILNIFKKNLTLMADVFSNLRTPKQVVTRISIKSRFRGPFDK